MAITIDQLQIGTPVSSGTAASITLTSNVVIAPNTLIVLVYGGDGPNNLSSITGSNGLTWTIDKQANNPTSTDRVAIASAPCVAGLASGVTFIANPSAGVASMMLGGVSILGADLTGSRVDGTPPAQVDSSAANGIWACASYTLAAGSILIAAGEVDTSTSSGPAGGSTEFLDKNEATSGNTTSGVYVIDGGSGGATTGGGTYVATGSARTSIGVAYKTAAGAAAAAPHTFTAIPFQAQGRNL